MSDTKSHFRPDVQGIRAVAVLLVVLYHAGGIVPAGFVGVDMFFVISGYVIMTTVQRRIQETGRFSLGEFLGRRVRRLFPAMALVIAGTMLLAPWFGTISSRTQTLRTGLFSSVSAANLYLYRFRPDGYFESKEKTNALLHLWSLAIEEQFYLGFAFVLALIGLIAHKRKTILTPRPVFVAFGVMSFVLCVALGQQNIGVPNSVGRLLGSDALDGDFNFYLPVTRAWEFIAGILLATLGRRISLLSESRMRKSAVLVLTLGTAVLITESRSFPGLVTLLPIGLTVLLIGQHSLRGAIGSILESRTMQWIGDRSYSWYLWHWPFVQFVNPVIPENKAALLLAAVCSLVPAHLSYELVETRFRSKGKSKAWTLGLTVTPLFVAGISFLISPTPFPELNVHLDSARGCESGDLESVRLDSRCTFRLEGSVGRAILVGDSHAGQLSEGFVMAAHKLGLDATIATRAGKPFLASSPSDLSLADDEFAVAIAAERPALVVVAQSRYPESLPEGVSWPAVFTPLISRFESEGIGVVVVNTSAFIYVEPQECSFLSMLVQRCEADVIASRDSLTSVVEDVLSEEGKAIVGTNAEVVDLLDVFCGRAACPARQNGRWMWRDSSHMSRYASELSAPYLEAAMLKVLSGN